MTTATHQDTPASGPLHLLFPLPGVLFFHMSAWLTPSPPSSIMFSMKASGKPHLWHILLYFSTSQITNSHTIHLIIYHAYCLSPTAPLECKLHDGLEESLGPIC